VDKLYRCDPDKNTDCRKTGCYRYGEYCWLTTNKKCRMNIFKRLKEWIKGDGIKR